MPETNPYESPKADLSKSPSPIAPGNAESDAGDFRRLLGIGATFGAVLGALAVVVLTNGRAASKFYLIYGSYGAIVGVIGAVLGGSIIALHRLTTRTTKRRPTPAAHEADSKEPSQRA